MRRAKQDETPILPLEQRGDLLRDVLERAAIGMALVGTDERLHYANPAFCEILGFGETDLADLRLNDVLPSDEVSAPRVEFERLKAGKIDGFKAECQYRRKDGGLVWVQLSVSLLREEASSRPSRILIQIIDIDKQKQASTEVANIHARWETALEAAGQGVWEFDRVTREASYSRGWKRLRGIPDDEIVPSDRESWLARVHPEDCKRIDKTSDQQGLGDDGFDVLEYRERHRDGHYIWIYSRGRPYIFDTSGNPLKAIGTDTDITRLKTIEAELAAEKERLRVTLQSIADGVISTDAGARIIFMNQIAEKMTGWTLENARGRPINEVFISIPETTGTGAELSGSVAKCLERGKIYRLDDHSLLLGRTGGKRYIRESAAPVRTETGEMVGAVMVFQDATTSRKLQQELAYSATHDSLTRLPNRMAFDTKFDQTIRDANVSGRRHALCLIDLDHFKGVNDSGGHAAGDALLRDIANRIKGACRTHDFVARIGGDEFAVILDDCSEDDALELAQTIVGAISKPGFVWGENAYAIGASIGIAPIIAHTGDADEFHRRADVASYEAKARGRNCVVMASGDQPASKQETGASRI